jgi:hypothetical protein
MDSLGLSGEEGGTQTPPTVLDRQIFRVNRVFPIDSSPEFSTMTL